VTSGLPWPSATVAVKNRSRYTSALLETWGRGTKNIGSKALNNSVQILGGAMHEIRLNVRGLPRDDPLEVDVENDRVLAHAPSMLETDRFSC
jgi:hypothetical protein